MVGTSSVATDCSVQGGVLALGRPPGAPSKCWPGGHSPHGWTQGFWVPKGQLCPMVTSQARDG